jgi:hypothetical protein
MAKKKNTKKNLNVKKKVNTPKKSTVSHIALADNETKLTGENSTVNLPNYRQEATPQVGYSCWYIVLAGVLGLALGLVL